MNELISNVMKKQKNWILLVVIVLCHWLFGQIYEAVVLSPNWSVDTLKQVARLNEFYAITAPRNYFEPIVPLGVLILWILFFTNKNHIIKKKLRFSSLFSFLAMGLNMFMVFNYLLRIFSAEHANDGVLLSNLCYQWNWFNILRIVLIAITLIYAFQAYILLIRAKTIEVD